MAKMANLRKGRVVQRMRRHKRIRKKVWGTAERPRFVVHRSLRNMEGQLVDDEQSQLPLTAPAGVDVRWLHRAGPSGSAHPGTLLVAAVEAMPRPDGAVDVFAHGERTAIKRLGAIFHGEWGIGRQEMSVSAYWAHGRAEDAFQAEKREAVGKIFAD